MHFFTIILTALAASASATPVALANNEDVAALNDIAVRQLPGCNVLNCAGVLGAVTCLVPLIGQVPPNVPALVDCVPGGTAALCQCATCVTGLQGFLTANGVCPAV